MATFPANSLTGGISSGRPTGAGTRNAVDEASARLSSGRRINSAKDDAAGLSVANAMEARRRGTAVAERNIGDAVGMVQTASGALGEMTETISRMRELATQSANGSLNDDDRANIQVEFASLQDEVSRVQGTTTFNGKQVLRASAPGGVPAAPGSTSETFQVGESSADSFSVDFSAPNLTDLLGGGGAPASPAPASVATADGARAAMDAIDKTMASVSEKQAGFGATLNGFDVMASNAQSSRVGMAEAESRLRDADVAEEVSNSLRGKILDAAKVSVQLHAMAANERVLELIKG